MRFIEVRLVDRHNLEMVEDAVTGTRSGTGNVGTDERGGSLNSSSMNGFWSATSIRSCIASEAGRGIDG